MASDTETIWLGAAFLAIALVYASVGQAGASGYIVGCADRHLSLPEGWTAVLAERVSVRCSGLPLLASGRSDPASRRTFLSRRRNCAGAPRTSDGAICNTQKQGIHSRTNRPAFPCRTGHRRRYRLHLRNNRDWGRRVPCACDPCDELGNGTPDSSDHSGFQFHELGSCLWAPMPTGINCRQRCSGGSPLSPREGRWAPLSEADTFPTAAARHPCPATVWIRPQAPLAGHDRLRSEAGTMPIARPEAEKSKYGRHSRCRCCQPAHREWRRRSLPTQN